LYSSNRKKLAYRVVFALSLLAIAAIFRFKFIPQESGGPFVTFYPAIILSFYLCGAVPGSLVAVLSGIIGAYYFIPPYNQFTFDLEIHASLIFFSITSGMIGIVSAYQQRNIEQLNILLDNEMIGSVMLKNRKIKWCNKAMNKILGYPESTLYGASTQILFADQEMFVEVGREAYPLKEGKPYRK
jgi:K+-sensing histidine kinase KdpD